MFFLLRALLVGGAVWGALHAYAAWRVSTHLAGRPRKWQVGLVTLGLWLLAPATFVVERIWPATSDTLVWWSFLYMGVFVVFLFLLLLMDGGLALFQLGNRVAGRAMVPERRLFLRRASQWLTLGGTGVLSLWGITEARRLATVVEQDVPLEGLGPAFEGYRIAHISDVHVGPNLKGDWLARVVGRVNALGADLVAVTGDLVDGTVETLRRDVAPLSGLRARDGVFFVTGNHEYYWDAEAWCAEVQTLGLDVLLNAHRVIERTHEVLGRRVVSRLVVGGCTDHSAGRHLAHHASDPEGAFQGAPHADVRLLLAHQPRSIDGAVRANVDLQLSGHTHGGQFFPVNLFVGLVHPFSVGLGRRGRTWIYVNRGTGYWGPPLRQGVSAEISLLRLVRA